MPFRFIAALIFIALTTKCVTSAKYLPLLIWHSAGETCCGKEVSRYVNFIERELNNEVTVRSVKIGLTEEDDFTNSLTQHPFEQIKFVCEKLRQNPIFHDGYNAIGLSQGALSLRGLAQICPFPPMRNLISLSGPHQGVNQYPRCEQRWGSRHCEWIQFKINNKAYRPYLQRAITPLAYWHDAKDETRYKNGSTFLALINNENHYNPNYVRNLQALKRLVLVKYRDDVSLVPNESSWFGFEDKDGNVLRMEQTEVYIKDKLGLRELQESGKLIRLESPLEHLKLNKTWFRQNIIPILKEE